jgi:protein SCO1/2
MPELSRRKLLGLAAMTPFAAKFSPSALTAPSTAPMDARERIRRRYFPEITLLTQDNRQVRFYEDLVKDKIVTINFFYAHCEGICPTVMANLVKVQKLLGNPAASPVSMISITLKPEEDSPAVLKEFAEMHRIKTGWALLTGKPEDIDRLRRSLGFTNLDPQLDQDKSQHIGNIRYGNEPLMEWAACSGMSRPEWIVENISWVFPVRQS